MRKDRQKQRRRLLVALPFSLALLASLSPIADEAEAEAATVGSKFTVLAVEESVRPIGRFRLRADDALEFAWPGSGFELDFEGSRLAITLSDPGKTWLDIEVNGETRPLPLQPGSHRYILVNDSPGRHRVRVTRRTEARSGRTALVALQADGRVFATQRPDRLILVIGDSISAGYGVEGKGPHCRFSFATENHNAGYAALAARALGAELHSIAVSGQGLLPKAGKPRATAMADKHHLVFPGGETWASADFQPAAVVIHLGTNDFYGRNPHQAFVEAYHVLLKDLGARYPNARLYGAIGPMLSGADRRHAEAAIAAALSLFKESSGRAAPLLTFEPAGRGHIHGCNWHPGRDSHVRMAEKLAKRLADDLGWSMPPLPPSSAASKP